jgi:hypothetical protein
LGATTAQHGAAGCAATGDIQKSTVVYDGSDGVTTGFYFECSTLIVAIREDCGTHRRSAGDTTALYENYPTADGRADRAAAEFHDQFTAAVYDYIDGATARRNDVYDTAANHATAGQGYHDPLSFQKE